MHQGCLVWTLTPPLACPRTPRPGPVLVCVCLSLLARSGGPAPRARSGARHLFLGALSFCFARPPTMALPLLLFILSALPLPFFFLFFVTLFPLRTPDVSCFLWFLAAGASGFGLCFPFSTPLLVLFFVRPVVSCFLWCPAPGARDLGAVCCLFCWSPAAGLSVCPRCFSVSCLAVGCSLVVAPRPPICVSRFLVAASCGSSFFLLLRSCLLAWGWSAVLAVCFPPPSPLVCFARLLLLGSACAPASLVFAARPLAAPLWLLPPPPFCVSPFRSCRTVLCFLSCAALLPCLFGARRVLAVCCYTPLPSSCLVCWSFAARLTVRPRCFCDFLPRRWSGLTCFVIAARPPLFCLTIFVAAARCSVSFSSAALLSHSLRDRSRGK